MNKYIVFLADGRQCELTADKINHFSDEIEFIQNENIIVAWLNPHSLAGYVICQKQEVEE